MAFFGGVNGGWKVKTGEEKGMEVRGVVMMMRKMSSSNLML